MPFTFCHPAIILPLSKSKKLSSSALIIGSTAPDFEYFIRMDMIRTHSHDFWAMFYFSLPLTFVLFFIFQTIVKGALISNLPDFLYYRFHKYVHQKINWFSIQKLLWILLSAIIGIFSHLLWDSFTHKTGFFESHLTFTLQHIYIFGKDYIVFQILQTWSSIIGGLYIVYYILKMPLSYHKNPQRMIRFWGSAILIALSIIYFRECNTTNKLIATSISSGLLSLFISSSIRKMCSMYKHKRLI